MRWCPLPSPSTRAGRPESNSNKKAESRRQNGARRATCQALIGCEEVHTPQAGWRGWLKIHALRRSDVSGSSDQACFGTRRSTIALRNRKANESDGEISAAARNVESGLVVSVAITVVHELQRERRWRDRFAVQENAFHHPHPQAQLRWDAPQILAESRYPRAARDRPYETCVTF